MHRRLVEHGKPVRFLRLQGERHGTVHKGNKAIEHQAVLEWFVGHLAESR